jgi:predicted transcriptional regulator
MASSAATQLGQEGLRRNEQKWTPALWDAGWTALPNVIIEHQRALGLKPVDLNILLHLCRYWWTSDNLPHPSKRTIAECMNVDISTIRRRIAGMERRGLIQRVSRFDKARGQKSNFYDFSGLIQAAQPLAKEAQELKERRREEDTKRRTRRPRVVAMD